MTAEKKRNLSLLSASLMAVLTLSVFMASPNRGPASAVTRFNEAVARRDARLLQAVSLGPIDNPRSVALQNIVAGLLANSSSFQVLRVERRQGFAVVYTMYKLPGDRVYEYVFITRYVQSWWLVDPDLTLSMAARKALK